MSVSNEVLLDVQGLEKAYTLIKQQDILSLPKAITATA